MLQDGQRKAYAGSVTGFWLNGSRQTNRSINMDIGFLIAFLRYLEGPFFFQDCLKYKERYITNVTRFSQTE
jgi:hypothetical protein